jgi:cell division septation protein DedD
VGVVVLLLAGAGLAGYLFGVGESERRLSADSGVEAIETPVPDTASQGGDDRTPVTFYTVLTEPRAEDPPAPVPETESPPQPPPGKEKVELPENAGSLMLQVASYRSREAAGELLKNLASEGYAGTIQVADLGDRGTWHRVRIGPYRTEKDAERVLENLRDERNLKGYIVR